MAGVVVGVSGSAGSEGVVRWAEAEALLRGESLTVLHVWDAPVEVEVETSGTATSLAAPGDPAAVLLRSGANMLVLGPGSHLGRVTHVIRKCLHEAACPVVVVHGEDRAPTRRVVVGVCGTDASRRALRWASEEARLRGAELVVVHAWQVHPHSAADLVAPGRAVPAQQGPAVDRLRGWVADVLGHDEVELRAEHGGTLEGLLDASTDADLLVIGRSTHGAWHRIALGAVGDDLSGLATCPVVVVPALEARDRALT